VPPLPRGLSHSAHHHLPTPPPFVKSMTAIVASTHTDDVGDKVVTNEVPANVDVVSTHMDDVGDEELINEDGSVEIVWYTDSSSNSSSISISNISSQLSISSTNEIFNSFSDESENIGSSSLSVMSTGNSLCSSFK
jgi:hypothetical protein